ncbi:hypothetical protein O6H91_08G025400 [Diphasiastrum complanatum]|uniref:Uncharacterized protein n=3 Tax=Diphasiastrum complanatum TaxID=34168 RepID=A0ACC2CVS6_DIPCM|nr:hypothetical protein O6H91_08G025400 [Diphasiastrum complanatum]KAJ7546119.1 hypothetical protein O6H91_08G025400 [Diphasiastrum complanatum]KAJ7546120.1 hypothetical protein O6H91_08G025400 [Diphasiastrum complanatum]
MGEGKLQPEARQKLECVDLSSDDEHKLAAQIRQACLESGFFYVVNHGIDLQFINEVFKHSKRFFSLPLEEKMKVLQDKNNRGYTPYAEEMLDPDKQSRGDSKEGYYIGVEILETDTRAKKPLHGPNLWPSSSLLPGWREIMEKYFEESLILSRKLIKLLALALYLDESYFNKPGMLDDPMAALRLLHYSAERSIPELGILGAGAHCDYGMLTLLATDSVPGLQICRQKDATPQIWEDVLPLEGAYVVNLGAMLERWSNGLFRATLHRVANPGKERYSIAFFMEPNFDCLVECLPTCHSDINPPKYPPMISGHYLLGRYIVTHNGFDSNAKSS